MVWIVSQLKKKKKIGEVSKASKLRAVRNKVSGYVFCYLVLYISYLVPLNELQNLCFTYF